MKIINIVNSFIGKKGNIGLRTSYIISELNSQKIKNFSYSRGVVKYFEKNNKNMRIFGHIPRILNAFRIYINLWFNHRKYDIWFFEKFFFLSYKKSNCENKIAHVWETSPKIIKKLKNDGFKVVLDLPIAPTATAKGLIDIFGDKIILHPHEYNDKLERESFILADKIISPSIFVKYELEKIGVDTKKIIVIPFGTDVKNIESKIFSKNYEKDGIDFVFAGNINKRKGVDFLLEAWNDDVFRNDRLHLCGRLYPEVEQLIKKYNLKNIITPGFINTRKYFTKCDVYVFPSLLEGSSKSIYKIYRTLKKDGTLVLSTPYIFGLHDKPYDFYRYTKYGLSYLLKDFKNVKIVQRNDYIHTIIVLISRLMKADSKSDKIIGAILFILTLVIYPLLFLLSKIVKSNDITTGYFVVAKK